MAFLPLQVTTQCAAEWAVFTDPATGWNQRACQQLKSLSSTPTADWGRKRNVLAMASRFTNQTGISHQCLLLTVRLINEILTLRAAIVHGSSAAALPHFFIVQGSARQCALNEWTVSFPSLVRHVIEMERPPAIQRIVCGNWCQKSVERCGRHCAQRAVRVAIDTTRLPASWIPPTGRRRPSVARLGRFLSTRMLQLGRGRAGCCDRRHRSRPLGVWFAVLSDASVYVTDAN